jgi:hypothetical protein
MDIKTLNLGWWNIGISPPIKQRNEKINGVITLAENYISQFLNQGDLDFFALCEVSENESVFLSHIAKKTKRIFINLSSKVNNVIIDIAIIYSSEKLEYVNHSYLTKTQPDGKSLRAGVKAVFKEIKNNDIIIFYLSHWPSKLRNNESIRENIATYIRQDIDNMLSLDINTKIICMGDYNTQPYPVALRKKLFATRDFHIINKKKRLLFNPFWKILADGQYNNIGTYFHSSPSLNRWYVFDQMLFSSTFVSTESTGIKLDIDSIDCHRTINDSNNKIIDNIYLNNFDHYPIFCGLNYE